MPLSPLFLALSTLSILVNSQSCTQFGTPESNGTCSNCPPGFGGNDCNTLLCSNPLIAPSSRSTFDPNVSGDAAVGCNNQCTSGFEGPNCNVCNSNQACSNALSSTPTMASQGLGEPICSTGAWTWTQGFGNCAVVNPTLQSVFPGKTTLTFQKTVAPSDSLSQNPGANHSITAALFYSAPSGNTTLTEQFYCAASSCVQSNLTTTIGSSSSEPAVSYLCQNLQCRCNVGTAFCNPSAPLDLTSTFNGLGGTIEVTCDSATGENCSFKQATLNSLFGQAGLALNSCQWGECVLPATINSLAATLTGTSNGNGGGSSLSGGVIAGLAVLGAIVALLLGLLGVGFVTQRRARRNVREREALLSASNDKTPSLDPSAYAPIGLQWNNLSYSLPSAFAFSPSRIFQSSSRHAHDGRTILPSLSGSIPGGTFTSILGPSGAGKSTLVDLLAGVRKAGKRGGQVEFIVPEGASRGEKIKVGYVDQHDSLPEMSTVKEAITFAADLRMGEISKETKRRRVFEVMTQLGLVDIADSRIGSNEKRGISGGERRRVSIALELVAAPAILIADEPTSGLDSTSALLIIRALKSLTTPSSPSIRPTTVIITIHQPSSQIFHQFDQVILLGMGGVQLYAGKAADSKEWFAMRGYPCPEGWNPADYFLDLATSPPRDLIPGPPGPTTRSSSTGSMKETSGMSSRHHDPSATLPTVGSTSASPAICSKTTAVSKPFSLKNQFQLQDEDRKPSTVTLTQFEVLAKREAKNLKRDWSLFFMHNFIAVVVGVVVGGMYFKVDLSIGGFQSRIGALFFLGCLLAFASLSALANFSRLRSIFLRERARAYYSPFAWVASRVAFDIVPLRIIPTIILGVIVYWMVGLSRDAEHFFKFLLILILYSIAMTLFNFLLAAIVSDTGIAILISSVINLFQMAFAGFFINLSRIPGVLRWLQWLSPLKYALEALSVNEVSSGLMIVDVLAGAKVQVSAVVIMETLFGFKFSAYYRDVLVLFGFIAGFAVLVVGSVVFKLRELR
ncbi:hypothetical protein JCM5350_001403 [Sporobolomyces pararoseus]